TGPRAYGKNNVKTYSDDLYLLSLRDPIVMIYFTCRSLNLTYLTQSAKFLLLKASSKNERLKCRNQQS
ncbi:MAG: hypothetical protein KDD60_08775, partial [Bdellovibrionales bacterium]|nr:hypothetical protein [Bdellovibrionales bacterium]